MSKLNLKTVLEIVDKASKPIRDIQKNSKGLSSQFKDQQTALRKLNQTQADITSFKRLSDALGKTRNEMQQARERAKQLAEAHAAIPKPTRAMTKELDRARIAVNQLKQEERDQVLHLQRLRQSLSQTGISTKNLSKDEQQLRTKIDSATVALRKKKEMLDRISQSQKKVNDLQRHSSELQGKFSQGAMQVAGAGMSAYAGARFIAPGTNLDSNMSRVQALTRLDKNSPELKALRIQAQKLGSETSFTAADAASGQAFLAMAGFTPESIKAAMPGMLSLAAAGSLDLGSTADIASNILTGMKMKADQMGQLGDVMSATMTRSNTDISMMGETMKYVAPVASGLGVDIETLAAATGKLGDAGLQGSMAGTALRSILGRLAAPPKAAAKALDQLSISTKDAKGNLRDLPTILTELEQKTSNMGNAQRAEFFKAIAGEEAFSGLQVLVEQAGNGALQELVKINKAASGEAKKLAETMNDNVAGDWTKLTSGFDGLRTTISDSIKDDLRDLLQTMTSVIGKFNEFAKNNPVLVSTMAKIIVAVLAIIAAMGVLTMTMVTILAPLAILKVSMATLGLKAFSLINVFTRIGGLLKYLFVVARAHPIILLITTLAILAYTVYKNWEPIKQFFGNVWESIKSFFSSGIANITSTIINWSPLGLFYKAFAGVMNYFGFQLPSTFTGFGQMLMQGLANGIGSAVGAVVAKAKEVASTITNTVKGAFGIHSPSRVFAELGAYNMQGLALGIDKNASLPSIAVRNASKDILGTFDTSGFRFDRRLPISSQSSGATAGNSSPMQLTINVYPSAGMDERSLAQLVAAEVAKFQRVPSSNPRSYNDID